MSVPYSTQGPIFVRNIADVDARQITDGQILKYDNASRTFAASSDTLKVNSTLENIDIGGSYDTTLGSDNTVVGVGAGAAIAAGASKNTILGTKAAAKVVTGDEHVAIGDEALSECVTNSQNVAIGKGAGKNTLGGANTFIGCQAGETMTNAGNVCIGHQVCADLFDIGNQAGSNNIIVGHTAGAIATTNFTCIAPDINNKVPLSLLTSNSVVLGNSDVTNTHLFGGGLTITESSGDITYKTTAASTKHTFMTNSSVEGLAIEDAKVKFQTEIRMAGEHASVAVAGTPSIRTIAFIDNELAYYNGTEWRKVRSSSF